MNKNIYIGVDPGKAGFITLLKDGEYQFFPMPSQKVPTGEKNKNGTDKMKSVFYEGGFRDLLFDLIEVCKGYEVHCAIERVIGRNTWSAENNFNFGYVAGIQKTIMMLLGAKITMVRPQKWQAIMYQNVDKVMVRSSTGKTMVHDTKATSKIVAKQIAPEIDFRKTKRSREMDDNKTDSFLMCNYIKKQFEKYGEELYSRQDE